jgi:hypothetical protein
VKRSSAALTTSSSVSAEEDVETESAGCGSLLG